MKTVSNGVILTKRCKYHGIDHPVSEFKKMKNKMGEYKYYYPSCIEAGREISRESRKAKYHDPLTQDVIKQQNKSYRNKPERKALEKVRNANNYLANSESIKNRVKEYRKDPKNKAQRNANWRENYKLNKDEIRKDYKERYHNDVSFRLRGNIRSRVWEALRRTGGGKNSSILKALPYSVEELKLHIERQFTPEMSWDDTKSFSIDHIIPQKMFPYSSIEEENFKLCWSLDNLRPLPLSQNFSEGDRESLFSGKQTFTELVSWVRHSPLGSQKDETLGSVKDKISNLHGDYIPLQIDGLSLLDKFFPHRFDSNTKGKKSLREAYSDNLILLRVISYIIKTNRVVTPRLIYRNMSFVYKSPSHFFPSAASYIVSRYAGGGSVLDPFIGWGGRALGSYCGGASHYTGIDIQSKSIDGCCDMLSGTGMSMDLYNRSFKEIDLRFKHDLLLTSPPFGDGENYGINDSSNHDCGFWIDSILNPLIDVSDRYIKSNGHIAIHLQDKAARPFRTICKHLYSSRGYLLIDDLKYGSKYNQSVMIFQRKII